ncbi:MAG: hypothetical protein J6D37_00080 [Clostridia bacterium]|nr:hypothetical protein [Clostridia bacterium]
MTVKQFLKGNAFKSLVVLLIIVILCGGVLSVCNHFLFVSDEERNLRAYSKLLTDDSVKEELAIDQTVSLSDGSVNKVCLTEKGNYLVQATGTGGYKGGTVTLWVLVNCEDGALAGIGKVQYESNTAQTLMANFNASYYEEFTKHNDEIASGALFGIEEEEGVIETVVTGTTKSSNAIVNAVNAAIDYVNAAIFGQGGTPVTPSDSLLYTKNIKSVTATVSRKKVDYSIEVKQIGNVHDNFVIDISVDKDARISAFEIKTNGSSVVGDTKYADKMADMANLLVGKNYEEIKALLGTDAVEITDTSSTDASLTTGATESNTMCLIAAAYATGNYDWYVNSGAYTKNVKSVTATVSRKKVDYSIEVKQIGNVHDNFVIDISVDKDAKISAFEIKTNGSSVVGDTKYADKMADMANLLVGKTYEEIKALLGTDALEITDISSTDASLTTGATESNTMCLIAAAYATANYATFIG